MMLPMVWSSVDSAIAIQDASPAAPQDRVSVGTPVTRHLAVHGHFFLKGNPRETFFFWKKVDAKYSMLWNLQIFPAYCRNP